MNRNRLGGEPPDKRRKKESEDPPDLWDDKDEEFTDDVLENIDNLIASSQAPPSKPHSSISSRSVGRGTPRSVSAGELHWKPANADSKGSSTPNTSSANYNRPPLIQPANFNIPQEKSSHVLSSKFCHGTSVKTDGLRPSPISGTTGSGRASPSLPSSSRMQPDLGASQLNLLKEKCALLSKELQNLKQDQYSKDGQIKILRDNLHQREVELNKVRVERAEELTQQAKERSHREEELEKKAERLTAELTFKEKEIQDIQNLYKRLERQLRSTLPDSPGVGKQRPVASPGPAQPTAGSSSGSPHKQNQFPSSRSFLALESSPIKEPRKRIITGAIACQTSPLKLEKPAVQKRRRKHLLNVTNRRVGGPQLVHHLMHSPTEGASALLGCMVGLSVQDEQPQRDDLFLAGSHLLPLSPDLVMLAHQANEHLLQMPPNASPESLTWQYLPMLLRALEAYINQLNSTLPKVPARTSKSHKIKPTASSSENSQDSSDSEIAVMEKVAINSLKMLKILVEHSLSLCHKILHDEAEAQTPGRQSPSTSHGTAASLLDQLFFLSSPVSPNKDSWNPEVCLHALKVLCSLLQQGSDLPADRFEAFLSDVPSQLLESSPSSSYHKSALIACFLEILTYLLRLPVFLSKICAANDECLLLQINLFLQALPANFTDKDRTEITSKFLDVVSALFCFPANGVHSVVNNSCQCSTMLVPTLILLLHKQLSLYTISASSITLVLLRRGISLLHALGLYHPSFTSLHLQVEPQYVQLVCGAERLFRSLNEDHSVNALQELWDFEDYPGGNEDEDSEEMEKDGPPALEQLGVLPSGDA